MTHSRSRPDVAEKWAAIRASRIPPNPSGLCECGCGAPTKLASFTDVGTGDVKGFPRRYLRGHNKRTNGPQYIVDETTGCWVWQLARTRTGYGSVKINGKTCKPHRVFYERRFGSVPVGTEIHHRCENRACCNPDHLEAITHHDNVRKSARQKLTTEQLQELSTLLETVAVRDLADRFGVTIGRIYHIRREQRHEI